MTTGAVTRSPWIRRWPGHLLWLTAAVGGSAVAAIAVSRGMWFELAALLLVVPAFLIVHRYPMVTVAIWMLTLPFMSGLEDGGSLKLAYWLIHRLAPLATLVIVVASSMAKATNRRLPRLGVPELLMAGYLIVSAVSVLYLSNDVGAELRHLYDRVGVPMILYLLVRLLPPKRAELRKLTYILMFVLFSQALIGLAQWLAPGLLPGRLLGRAGERTTGSLDQANVFGIVALFSGTLVLHLSRQLSGNLRRWGPPCFALGVLMAFATFSRASWLAALVVLAGVFFAYRNVARVILVAGVVAVAAFLAIGSSGWLSNYLRVRVYSQASETTALSRLPVIIASVRMFEEKPLTGWGYGNFDRYDTMFQSRVGDLFVPTKDHSSHNLFLTILAEQGLVGIVTYLGAAAYWLVKTPKALSRLRMNGAYGRKLVVILWFVLLGHVIVNLFSDMVVSFGLAVWWLSLALIGNALTGVDKVQRPSRVAVES